MSEKYDLYLKEHIAAVESSWKWLVANIGVGKLRDICGSFDRGKVEKAVRQHDASKYAECEYKAYDDFFYGDDRNEKVKEAFNYAWLHHLHVNPHHWQHWIFLSDDEGMVAMEMPNECILEMICDWWTFSWRKGDLYEIFRWWSQHEEYIVMGEKTRQKVMDILEAIRLKLDSADAESVVMIVEN